MPPKIVKKTVKSKTRKTIVRKKKAKLRRRSVLRMMATMEPTQSGSAATTSKSQLPTPDEPMVTSAEEEFLQTGRTGRRNALPDILDASKATVSSSDLPARLESLSTQEKDPTKDASKEAGASSDNMQSANS